MKKLRLVCLIIIPAIVFTFNFFFVKNQDRFYMNWTDSSYAYLYNGMNLANGKMEIGHTDNPGTTVQLFAGVLIKSIHVISGKNPDLVTDVLTDPEKYLHIMSFIFILVSCLILFYLGYVADKLSGNTALAIFIQSGALVFFTMLTCMADIRSEPLLIMGGFLYTAICFSFIHEKEITQKRMYGYSIKFAVICAFLIITKMTALPVILLPFFLLRKWKTYLLYIFTLPLFTVLFFFPALPKAKFMFQWIHDLFFHSGIYGQGKANIVDLSIVKENFFYLLKDIPFTISSVIIFAALVTLAFRKQFKFSLWKENVNLRLLTGIFIVTLSMIVIVLKQFKYHYLLPADGFLMLGVYLSLRLVFPATSAIYFFLRNQKIQVAGVSLIILLCSFNDFHQYNFYDKLKDPKIETANFMKKYKNVPRLYMTYEYYFAEAPPAMYYGSVYAGDERFDYYKRLQKIYPRANFYEIPTRTFHGWGTELNYKDFINANKQVLVCFYFTDTFLIRQSLADLRQLNGQDKVVDLKQVYANPLTGEQVYELNRVGEIQDSAASSGSITCDAEKLVDGSLMSTSESCYVDGALTRTQKEFHSGNFALALNHEFQYGFGVDLDAKASEQFEITAWRKNANDFGTIIAASADGKLYVSGADVIEEGKNGWKKIRLSFVMPADFSGNKIKVFAWNENKNETVYFDDFNVVYKREKDLKK